MATAEEKAAAKKQELLAALEELHITATSGTETIAPLTGEEDNAKLAEILKAAKAEAKAAATPKGPITVKYRDHIGQPTERTFSEEVHGPDFAKLAEDFKATNASKIIK